MRVNTHDEFDAVQAFNIPDQETYGLPLRREQGMPDQIIAGDEFVLARRKVNEASLRSSRRDSSPLLAADITEPPRSVAGTPQGEKGLRHFFALRAGFLPPLRNA